MRVSDAVSGAVCVAAGAALAFHAASFPRTAVQAYGPGFFPALLGIALAASGLLLIGRGLAARQPLLALPDWVRRPAAWARLATLPACVLAYMALAPVIGFLGAASLPTAAMLAALTHRPALSMAVAVGSALAIWLVFAKLLLVPLPVGPLEALLA